MNKIKSRVYKVGEEARQKRKWREENTFRVSKAKSRHKSNEVNEISKWNA